MSKTIQQTVQFDVRPEEVYETYLDPERHGEAVGTKVVACPNGSGGYAAFDGALKFRTLHAIPGKLIVQSWRGHFTDADPDSVLVLTLEPTSDGGTRVSMVHANVPEKVFDSISNGWNVHYWQPLTRFFASKA